MEASFLNFHDEEHFSDFSTSLDHQHNLLEESRNTLVRMVDNDFDYVEGLGLDSNDAAWETEQEINGDLAILPVSGVAGVIPKIDNIKEDFTKVLTDWQEHIGFLQSTELEEDIDMVNLDMGLDMNLIDNTFDNTSKTPGNVSDSPKYSKGKLQNFNNVLVNTIKCESNAKRSNHLSESDHSEKEIDVVGLDLIEDVNPIIDLTHVRRQHATSSSKECNYKSLGSRVTILKEELLNDVVIKEEILDLEDEMPLTIPAPLITEFSKSSKRKNSKKFKKEDVNKKSNKKSKNASKANVKVSENSKIEMHVNISAEETSTFNGKGSKKTAVLEAGDVKSLLEQFEATEAASITTRMPEISQMPKIPLKKNLANSNVNTSEATLVINSVNGQDSKLHQDIRETLLPKEVIDRIKASGCKRTISVIPARPNKKTLSKGNGMKMQEAAVTISRNKLLKMVTGGNSNARLEGSVQLDHDYCSNTSAAMNNGSSNSDGNGNSYSAPGSSRSAVAKPWPGPGSKKDNDFESGEMSDAGGDQTSNATASQAQASTAAGRPAPAHENKIQSALAMSILQQQRHMKCLASKQQLVSVLKKQQQPQQKVVNLVESIVTTTNSSNGQVQNIIVQETSEAKPEDEGSASAAGKDDQKKQQQPPARRKLNLAEYRSRRFEQSRSDGSRTSSPVQPMTLVYVHHVSSSTEPMCCDREIVSVLKPKSELEEEKLRPKVLTGDKATQTAQSVFGLYTGEACCSALGPAVTQHDEPQLQLRQKPASEPLLASLETARPCKSRNYRRARARASSSSSTDSHSRSRSRVSARRSVRRRTRSHSRSRSRSRSRSHSRSRERYRQSRTRSSSRSRSNASRRGRCYARRRRISHRRSSVSSSSSWSSSSHSSSRSHSGPRLRSRSRSKSRSRSSSSTRYRSSSRSSCRSRCSRYSSCSRKPYDEWYVKEKQRQVEERRVIYVGRVKDGITKAELRRRFEAFGPVVDISVHFREHGHNYGFVTFAYKNDAYQAVEHGNDDPTLPRYDLCFGGRRAFCKVKYADLDGAADESMDENRGAIYKPEEENTFDLLLKEAQAKLRKRKV